MNSEAQRLNVNIFHNNNNDNCIKNCQQSGMISKKMLNNIVFVLRVKRKHCKKKSRRFKNRRKIGNCA